MSDDLDVVRLQDLEKRVASLEGSGIVKAATEVRRLQRAIEAALGSFAATGFQYADGVTVGKGAAHALETFRNEMKQTGTYTAPGEKG